MDIDDVDHVELSLCLKFSRWEFEFNKFFLCTTQMNERPEQICTSLNRKRANAVDRAVHGDYNKGKILNQPRFSIGQRVRILTRIFPLDEGFHQGNKGGWDV